MRARALIQLAAIGWLCATSAPRAKAEALTDEEVFAQVFRSRDTLPRRAPVELVIDGTKHGTLVLELGGASPRFLAGAVLAALEQVRVRAEIGRDLAHAIRDGRLTVADLRAANLDATYDPQRLELRIALPATATAAATHSFAPDAPAELATAVRPSDVSGYVNLFARGGNRVPPQLTLDSAINVERWVLEARADLGASSIGFHRGDVLLSRDDPRRALRYLAGDFAVAPGGVQQGFPVLGIGVTRNFTLQPYRLIQPVGAFHFTLDRPASVTVLVNGVAVHTLSLPAGRHDVRSLPLAAGVNDIELVIRDDTGGERRLQFATANPAELLAPGIDQFSLSLGFPLVSDTGMRDYAWSRPVISGRRRWGMTERLTLGGSVDGDLHRQVIGGSLAVATARGNLAVDLATSHDSSAGVGHAASIRYDYHRAAGGTATNTLTIAGRLFSPQYRRLAALDVDGDSRGDASLAATRMLGARVFGRLSLRYHLGHDVDDAYDAAVTLSRSFGGLSVDAQLGIHAGSSEPRDARLFVTAQWRAAGGAFHARSRATTAAGASHELRFSSVPQSPSGRIVASAQLHESRAAYGGEIALAYSNDRLTSSVTGATALDRPTGQAHSAITAEAGTALAFAGGRVAWSRPIANSFAIVDRNTTLRDRVVGVNPVAGGYTAQADRFGPAVVPNLEPYRLGSVRLEAPNLRLGTSLGPASHTLLPTYKSGTLLVVGEPGTVFVRGRLQHTDGTPLAFAVAEILPAATLPPPCRRDVREHELQARLDCLSERPAVPPVAIMTNRAGRFSVTGLSPGRYAIRLPDAAPIPFAIPAGTAGVYFVGALAVTNR